MVLAAGNSVAGVAGAVGVAMDPTASDSCAAVSLAGPIRWDTENRFGAGLYSGGCGLGIPFGGLYYC